MSAGRSASSLLITLLMTIVLFVVFMAWSRLDILQKHAYDLGYGWKEATTLYPVGDCGSGYANAGFPLKSSRDDRRDYDPSGCEGGTNVLARDMNYALYFAAAGIVSVGIVEMVRSRLP